MSIVVVVAVVFFLVGVVVVMVAIAAYRRTPAKQSLRKLEIKVQAVDVFELLALADQLAELRGNSGGVTRGKEQYQAIRLQLLDHIKVIAANAAIILRIAQGVRRNPGEQAADGVEQLINDAL